MKQYDDIFITLNTDRICVTVCPEQAGYDMETEWHSIAHSHPSYELHYICDGEVTLSIQQKNGESESVFLQTGDIAIIEPNIYHNTKTSEHSGKKFSFTFAMNRNSVVASAFRFEKGFCLLQNLEVKDFFDHLINCTVKKQKSYFDTDRKAYLMLIFSKILVALQKNRCKEPEAAGTLFDRMQRRSTIDEFFDLLNRTDFSRKALAEKLHLSEKQTSRILQQETGKNFRTLLNEKYIQYAKMLLTETDLSVEQIAEKVHFSSASAFIRAFEKACGTTPKRYRKQNSQTDL